MSFDKYTVLERRGRRARDRAMKTQVHTGTQVFLGEASKLNGIQAVNEDLGRT